MVMMMMTLHVFTETDHSTASLKKNKKVKKSPPSSFSLPTRCRPGGRFDQMQMLLCFFLAEKQYAVW